MHPVARSQPPLLPLRSHERRPASITQLVHCPIAYMTPHIWRITFFCRHATDAPWHTGARLIQVAGALTVISSRTPEICAGLPQSNTPSFNPASIDLVVN